jgi:type II secretory pathway component PulJ
MSSRAGNRRCFATRGFSLAETLIAAAIFAFLIVALTSVLNIGNLSYPVNTGYLELQQQVRQAMAWLVKEAREADASSVVITVLGADSDRLVFNTPTKSNVQYYRDTADINGDGRINQLIREYPAGARRVVAGDITRLKFTHSPSTVLNIEVRSDKTVMLRALSFSFAEKVRLRND